MATPGRINSAFNTKHIALNMALRIAVTFLMALGFLLYASIFVKPTLLRKMLLGKVVLCDSDNQYSKPNTPSHFAMRSDVKEDYSISEQRDTMDTRTVPLTHKEAPDGPGQEEAEQTSKGSNLTYDQLFNQWKDHGDQGGESAQDQKQFSILVGVMTTASKMDRRSLLRLAYNGQSSTDASVSVRFIIAGLDEGGGADRILVGMENATYGDIIVLNCSENLNEGKTFTFFSSLPDRGLEYTYVMKTDDDSYIRFENLGKSLKGLSRTDLYYGYILPCDNDDPYSWYMAGMGYLISWDLVVWIRDSPVARNKSVGTEDQLVGDWFNEGGVAKHRVTEKPLFYDHPEFGGPCAHELVPETILVHQVKTSERWADVLGFFEKDRISRALSLSS